jgi:hypothetical protein
LTHLAKAVSAGVILIAITFSSDGEIACLLHGLRLTSLMFSGSYFSAPWLSLDASAKALAGIAQSSRRASRTPQWFPSSPGASSAQLHKF